MFHRFHTKVGHFLLHITRQTASVQVRRFSAAIYQWRPSSNTSRRREISDGGVGTMAKNAVRRDFGHSHIQAGLWESSLICLLAMVNIGFDSD